MGAVQIAVVLASPFLAAFLSGYLVTRWKGREDAIEKRLDEITKKIDEVATTASAYWFSEFVKALRGGGDPYGAGVFRIIRCRDIWG